MSENLFQKAETFASDAAVDTAADGAINNVIDGVASHIPGGGAMDAMIKTGVDLAANNAINAELGGLKTRFFGKHDIPETPASPAATDEAPADGSN